MAVHGINSMEEAVCRLVQYGIDTKLLEPEDGIYTANQLFDLLKIEPSGDFQAERICGQGDASISLEEILAWLLDDAVKRGLIDDGTASRDLFDTRIMGILMPRPSEVIRKFNRLYQENPVCATDYFYRLSCDSDYIRTYRIRKDQKWVAKTVYGDLDITINLSKPEKDPKAIAAALHKKQNSYPRCLLCPENEGYAGRLDHPARQTIRLIPIRLNGEKWRMQYSPYVYYNEHCIILSEEHKPMKISGDTFAALLDFVEQFPHYTIGSNADLPIVGGSILTHEHFQGGRYTFAMEKAKLRQRLSFDGYEEVTVGIVDWPMSVLRLCGKKEMVSELAGRLLASWREYSDETAEILAYSGEVPHNTITPIARRRGADFELDLVLRNNRTSEEHPLGIFHPHEELHHIKKENIGLIEVMGLAVLPARLKDEIEQIEQMILSGEEIRKNAGLTIHSDWIDEIMEKYPQYRPEQIRKNPASQEEVHAILQEEIGLVFAKVLEHCGVFKDTNGGREAFLRFIEANHGKYHESEVYDEHTIRR